MQDWFATWFDTDYYHLLYGNRDYAEADRFIANLFAAEVLRPGDSICDLACGKGRHALSMHQHGAKVMGLDLSPNSIAEAQTHTRPGLAFAVHDMRQPLPPSPSGDGYDAITNLFTSFGYFSDRGDNLLVMANIYHALRPGGTLVLDFFNAQTTVANLHPQGEERREGPQGQVRFSMRKTVEAGVIVKRIHVEDGHHKADYEERVQALYAHELQALAEQAGLQVRTLLGNYELHPFREEASPRCILIAQRRGKERSV